MEKVHKSVLLKEVLDFLRVKSGEKYIDATLGQAGHSLEIAKRGGLVLGIEANPQTLAWLAEYLESLPDAELKKRIKVAPGNFKDLERIALANDFSEVCGILFDLGLSTFELTETGLGFSFLKNEPLDMRFDPGTPGQTAAGLVNGLEKDELYGIFTKFGEERDAERICSAIVRGRRVKRIETSNDLVSLIESAYQPRIPRYELLKHLAKVFQSLRIAVNDELESLKQALPAALKLAKPGGTILVISFHSLEDRIVKNTFLNWQGKNLGHVLLKNPVTPAWEDLKSNPSGRSAKLRVFKKI